MGGRRPQFRALRDKVMSVRSLEQAANYALAAEGLLLVSPRYGHCQGRDFKAPWLGISTGSAHASSALTGALSFRVATTKP